MASKSMIHLNGNILCAVDVETTGDRPGYHDLVQICVLPLDSELKPYLKIPPFYCELQPKRPENWSKEASDVNRLRLCKLMQVGLDPCRAADYFDEWVQRLDLAFEKRISPLAQNWPFDRGFIIDWLGEENFRQFFDGRYRDTMAVALYMNDRADFHVEQVPHPKVNLKYLSTTYKVPHDQAHDALQDCIVTAEVYRQMVKQ